VELLFVALGGVVLGIIARLVLPGRSTQGWILVPAIGAAAASVVWVALTWLGWKWDAGWIWLVSLGLAEVVSVGAALILWRLRTRSDRRMLHELTKTGAPRSA
jgi:uncharacterized membrane protein YeaQ/YmgE (transglycosylase-associated protein family)